MDNKEKNDRVEKTKDTFSNFWQKTSNVGKKAAEGARAIANQTKKNIHDAQAKKYFSVTEKEFTDVNFSVPNIIKVVDDLSNRKFITCEDAIGWIEKFDDIDVLHMYVEFAKKCGLQFIPVLKKDGVYCVYKFDINKFIDVNDVFKITTDEKVAELEKVACDLGAKSCSIEIVESDSASKGTSVGFKVGNAETSIGIEGESNKKIRNVIRGKTTVRWNGSDMPKQPYLSWFAHNESIKNLIDMRLGDRNAIKSKCYELSGLSFVTMDKKIAGVIDNISGLKGNTSMGNKVSKELNSVLMFEIEF